MFDEYVQEDDCWEPSGRSYATPEDAHDDYGEENVKPVLVDAVYTLHDDERDNGEVVGLLIRRGLAVVPPA